MNIYVYIDIDIYRYIYICLSIHLYISICIHTTTRIYIGVTRCLASHPVERVVPPTQSRLRG